MTAGRIPIIEYERRLPERIDENVETWLARSHAELARIAAALHKQRNMAHQEALTDQILAVRRSIADVFLRGAGIEVGAGPRPWPVPDCVEVEYGDIRDRDALERYFGRDASPEGTVIDAQTLDSVADASLDFVLSAHVIEHLQDPLGSIRAAMRCLRPGGSLLLAVPDMRHTFDRKRSPTPLSHLLSDLENGGAGTRLEAYEEFIRDVEIKYLGRQPKGPIEDEAAALAAAGYDIHFHAWTPETFREMLEAVAACLGFEIAAETYVINEMIFALRRRLPLHG